MERVPHLVGRRRRPSAPQPQRTPRRRSINQPQSAHPAAPISRSAPRRRAAHRAGAPPTRKGCGGWDPRCSGVAGAGRAGESVAGPRPSRSRAPPPSPSRSRSPEPQRPVSVPLHTLVQYVTHVRYMLTCAQWPPCAGLGHAGECSSSTATQRTPPEGDGRVSVFRLHLICSEPASSFCCPVRNFRKF